MKKNPILKLIRNLLFFIGLIIFTFWFLFKDQDINELINVVKSANIIYVLLGLLLMFLFYLTEAYNIHCILKTLGEKISLLKELKFTLIGFFFSSITPAATGGQPIELYYIKKENISGSKSTIALLMQLCGYQISTISLGIICAILNPSILHGGLLVLFIIGVLINCFALSIMLICIFSKKMAAKILNGFIKTLTFFRVKNIDSKKENLENGLEKYNNNATYIKEHKSQFIKSILRVFVQISFFYSVPFCIYKSFNLSGFNFFQIFTMQAVLYTTVSSLPLPGAVGISETVFLKIFEKVFGIELLSGAMVLNRGITFYFYVLLSLVVVIINAITIRKIKDSVKVEERNN